ncbi:MAG: hypothetical protein A2252_11030 [Elusimicrobia bacterium RIFOXYA2_FULL_39_19]|nr:MAG: hypothetical protein A2252_11030 [Elusimicrobia bacterium RIFOXYA2_FULL_39_19]
MKIAYFNCSSGIAGDMILSSIFDCGLKSAQLENYLKKHLKLKNWKFKIKRVQKGHTDAINTVVDSDFHFHSPFDMLKVLKKSTLPEKIKADAIRTLDLLITAESKIHGIPRGQTHFHELSSIDTIIDISGAISGFFMLGIEKIFVSDINVGRPEPATIEMLSKNNISIYSTTVEYELATPTGIALVSTIMQPQSLRPVFEIKQYGFGAGTFDVPKLSNKLTLQIGEMKDNYQQDSVMLIETNIDDLDPRVYPYVSEKLFEAGALDVWLTNIIMKKGRPAVKLSVLCEIADESKVLDLLFKETTTIGVRKQIVDRTKLARSAKGKNKTSILPDGSTKTSVEYREALKFKASTPATALYKLLK